MNYMFKPSFREPTPEERDNFVAYVQARNAAAAKKAAKEQRWARDLRAAKAVARAAYGRADAIARLKRE